MKQKKLKRKEIEDKEVETKTKNKIKINFSKKDFYKICVFVLALRLAPKNVFWLQSKVLFSQIKIKID